MIHLVIWSKEGTVTETRDLSRLEQADADKTARFWLDLEEPTEQELDLLTTFFHFHPLTIKAVKDFVGSPKLDIYENYLFLVLHRVFYRFETETCELRELELFFSEKFIVSIHPAQLSRTFQTVREKIKEHRHELGQHGTSFLLSRVLTMEIQDHKPAIEAWQEMLDHIEESTFLRTSHSILEKILTFKKLVACMRKSLLPEHEIIEELYETKEIDLIVKGARPYFKTVLDNMKMLMRDLESLRDHANSVFDTYAAMLTIRMTESSHQLNFVMQRLTIAATIFLPLTFIAGVYGMNFKFMPELTWKWGYFIIWGIMLTMLTGMLYYFRRKKWL